MQSIQRRSGNVGLDELHNFWLNRFVRALKSTTTYDQNNFVRMMTATDRRIQQDQVLLCQIIKSPVDSPHLL